MKILVAQIPMPENRFLIDLNTELAEHCQIHHSSDDFWDMKGEFDVIHLHFPEHLTFPIEAAYFDGLEKGSQFGLSDSMIQEVEKRLKYWASRAKLVVTRHVLLPHDAVEDTQWEKMYETFYRYADGVAHFANASIAEFEHRYRNTKWNRGTPPLHVVIPHQNYTTLPNTISRQDARRRLGISDRAQVLLVFGAIRNGDTERNLILNTFHNAKVPRKLLLISRWREKLAKVKWIRLKYWLRDLTRLYYRLHPSYCFNYSFVKEEDAQIYLNAADVLFIPRLKVLNSGNITLGLTFGKIVVGPDSWDVGELLKETGNPTFDPDRPETAAKAVEEGFKLAAIGELGPKNQKRALEEWSAKQCAEMYYELFKAVSKQSSLQKV
jgi:glycosyltransferase involved in cell wall biosynthesis